MTDHKHKKQKTPYQNFLVPGVIGLAFLAAVGFVIKVMLTNVGPRKKEQISTVTLLKPPPPPDVKEKPPEPEVPKEAPKQTIETPVDTPQPQEAQDQPQDNTPAGSELGVEGEGGAGSDAFGLRGGIKGGRSITLGGGGGKGGLNRLSLLTRYGGYVAKMQEEIKSRVRKTLDQNGGIPKGKLHALVKISLDGQGRVLTSQIVNSSGDDRVDEAIRTTLRGLKLSEPPPEGMPSGMTLKISSQG